MLRMSYSDHFFSVLCPCIRLLIVSNDFSSEAAEPILRKFHMEPPKLGEWKIPKMVAVSWLRWRPCPCMVKTFKNLFLQNPGMPWAESLHKSSGMGGLPKLLKWWSYIDVWPFYGEVKFASLCICMGPYINFCLGKMLRISNNFASGPMLLKFQGTKYC